MNGTAEPLTGDPPQEGRRSHRKLTVALGLVLALLLALFLPPLINLKKYRRSITNSISGALGRPASVGDMQLRLLPTPGIVMTDFTVAEDPAFGFEPALHANSMVARLRISSLWRGRLEVSRISLDQASLNLVKNNEGQWNIASILLRASQIPNEATEQRHTGHVPRFPYVEATSARINFKAGVEKRPFSLSNAEFAMWQASSGEWRLRLKAQPVRTDLELHLSDTGVLTVEGSLRRAASIAAMPVNLQAEWSGAQLGQASRLLAGTDSGWRGDLDATATIYGTVGNMEWKTRVRIGSLQRQEFQPASALNLDARCDGRYQNALRLLQGITCFLPEGRGHFLLTGNVQWLATPSADLQLAINQVPVQIPLSLVGLMRLRAEALTANGTANGGFHLTRGDAWALAGEATATDVSVISSAGTMPVPDIHLTTPEAPPAKPSRGKRPVPAAVPTAPAPLTLVLQPVALDLGGSVPMTLDARLMVSGFAVHAKGAASLDRLKAFTGGLSDLGDAVNAVGAKGSVALDATSSGAWIAPVGGGPTVTTTGSMRVQNVELRPGFLPAPVEIESAEIALSPETVDWQNVAFRYQGLAMHGSLQFPAGCVQPCPATFALQPGDASAAVLESAVQGRREGFFGQMLADLGGAQNRAWPPLTGTVQWKALALDRLAVQNATAAVSVEGTSVNVTSLDGEALGGTLHASGTMTVESGIPHWALEVHLKGAQPSQAAALFKERWGEGTANLDATLNLSGTSAADLASSTAGHLQFTWLKGGLTVAGPASPLTRFDRWTGEGSIAGSTVTMANSTISRGNGATTVEGQIGFDRRLNLALESGKTKTQVSGTLEHPALAH